MSSLTDGSKLDAFPLPVVTGDEAPLPEAAPGSAFDRRYWRSVEEALGETDLASTVGPEFPPGADDLLDAVGRRDFLRLLGASMALAGVGTAGCTRPPTEKILPYHATPPELTPGNALHFATAATLDGAATGLLVTSREGRPIKIEGNPDHPTTLGGIGVLEQAALLQLYDPDRAKQLRRRQVPASRGALEAAISAAAGKAGEGLYFLLGPSGSPLLDGLRQKVQARLPKARFFAHAPLAPEARWEGARLAFGAPLEVVPDFAKAKVVLALDDDFLEARGPNLGHARQWAQSRLPGPSMGRLYVVEGAMSVTGTVADHRLRLRPSRVGAFLEAVRALVGGGSPAAGLSSEEARFAKALAADLRRAGKEALVTVGPGQPAAVHAQAHALNAQLGGKGTTFRLVPREEGALPAGPDSLRALAEAMRLGEVQTLVITASNPLYSAYADLDLGALLAKVPRSFYLSLYEDETAAAVEWLVPALHPLECWGDARALDGTVSLCQPLLAPLYPGLCEAQLLAAFAGDFASSPRSLLEAQWQSLGSLDRHLQLGVVAGSAPAAVAPPLVSSRLPAAPSPVSGLEVAFARDYKVYDGRFANNAWLQELPDPITKLTWDNAALLSPATAARLGVKARDVVKLTVDGRSVEAPVCLSPGQADDLVVVALGYGRRAAGKVGTGVGFDAYRLRTSAAPWFAGGASVAKVGRTHPLALTQEHWAMEDRPLAIDTPLSGLPKLAEALESLRGPVPTLQPDLNTGGDNYQWAMAVDLNLCTGCTACVVACQSENNIPVVGREGVAKSREMHWLRIDRYYQGPVEDPQVLTQPLACVHCEKAPCEYACPVNATVHSDEGLNEMVYNRCIGTRYCSNNCPYKVRRFNYLGYTANKSPVEKMPMNPDVTVRARGVMEKCTYCVQRIERRRIDARLEGRQIRDGELKTACQQACPTTAITFGSLHDPQSRVSQLHRSDRRYDLLHELGTRPRTVYLARVRNPNPELA